MKKIQFGCIYKNLFGKRSDANMRKTLKFVNLGNRQKILLLGNLKYFIKNYIEKEIKCLYIYFIQDL